MEGPTKKLPIIGQEAPRRRHPDWIRQKLPSGDTYFEVREVMRDTRRIGVDILTLGQYLRPSKQHLDIARYVHPDEFAMLAAEARAMGFPHVEAGPLVRSSYHADGQRDIVRELTLAGARAAT